MEQRERIDVVTACRVDGQQRAAAQADDTDRSVAGSVLDHARYVGAPDIDVGIAEVAGAVAATVQVRQHGVVPGRADRPEQRRQHVPRLVHLFGERGKDQKAAAFGSGRLQGRETEDGSGVAIQEERGQHGPSPRAWTG